MSHADAARMLHIVGNPNRTRPMSNRRNQLFALATLSAAALLSPVTASAQLGRLKKAAADAAKEKAGVKTEAPTSSSSSNSANFVITADRLSAVIAVMETGMAKAEKEAAARAVETDYKAKKKTYDACVETQLQAVTGKPPAMDGIQKSAALSTRSADLGQKMVKAQQSGDYRGYIAMSDTVANLSVRSALVMYGADAKCGAPVYMPPALVIASADKMAQPNGNANANSGGVVVAPEQRAGMTTQQFGMVRERMALWVLQQTNNAPVGNNKYGVFTSDEQAVLDAQGAKIKKWAPVFKDQPNTWAGWGDLKSW